MELYGPFNLVANTALKVSVTMLTRGVRILNGSQFDLHVSFSPPGTTPSAGGPFNVAVGPRGRESYMLPPALFQGGRWGGDVWVYPTLSTGQAISSVINTAAVVRVEAYYPNEPMPQSTAVGTAYDQTSQARVLALPMVPTALPIVQGAHVAGTFAQGFDPLVQLLPLTMPAALTAWTPYLYGMTLTQTGALWVQVLFAIAVEHSGGTWTIYAGSGEPGARLWAGRQWTAPPFPWGAVAPVAVTSTDLGVFLIAGNVASYPAATTPTYDGTVLTTTDTTAQAVAPGIGSGAQTQAGTFY